MRYQFALTRSPSKQMQQGITTQSTSIDFELACQQHQTYIKYLKRLGLTVYLLDALADFPDSHFVEDAGFVHCQQFIPLQPGAKSRKNETQILSKDIQAYLPVIKHHYDETHRIDGGDILFASDRIYVGISERTNIEGAAHFKSLVLKINPNIKIEFIHYDGVLHLKSGLIHLRDHYYLGNPLMKLASNIDDIEILWLPETEGYAANCLVVNQHVMIFQECPYVESIVKKVGLNPLPMDLSEFRKMDGSFTCLSLLW